MLSQRILVGLFWGIFNSLRMDHSQSAWHPAKANEMYSASVEDNATTFCFFVCQETAPDPRLKTYPETIPKSIVPFTNLRILRAASQCSDLGDSMNLLNILTEKVRLGRVAVKYMRLPIILRYPARSCDVLDGLRCQERSGTAQGFVEASKGCVGSGLEFMQSCKGLPTCANRSKYVYWDAVHFTEEMYKIISEEALNSLMKSFA
nr:GDSL esterase/lipase At5g45950-like [Tanacetum cinerariifolium]